MKANYEVIGELPPGWAMKGWRRVEEKLNEDGFMPFLTPEGQRVFVRGIKAYRRSANGHNVLEQEILNIRQI